MNSSTVPGSIPKQSGGNVSSESLTDVRSIDEIIQLALDRCEPLPDSFTSYKKKIRELYSRLAFGRLHLAVIGEFNRGKSTFINSLIRTDLLPTSILPITSVPTQITYGETTTCTINFLKKKPALTVTASTEAVQEALMKYVAEENNPNNTYGVRSVEVTVPAPLLENGTVLIDTPGFGSTYLHNTQSALQSLSDCDAVLFLLSVDLPLTQAEIEFLKLIVKHIPRVFFILNKIDLLTETNSKKIETFIEKEITDTFKFDISPTIFPISARLSCLAKKQSNDDRFCVAHPRSNLVK